MAPRHWLIEEMDMRRRKGPTVSSSGISRRSSRRVDISIVQHNLTHQHPQPQPTSYHCNWNEHTMLRYRGHQYWQLQLMRLQSIYIYIRSVNTTYKCNELQSHSNTSLSQIQSTTFMPSCTPWVDQAHSMHIKYHHTAHYPYNPNTHLQQEPQNQHNTK